MESKRVPTLCRVEILVEDTWLEVLDSIGVTGLQSRTQVIKTAMWMAYRHLLAMGATPEYRMLNDDRARYLDRVVEHMAEKATN